MKYKIVVVLSLMSMSVKSSEDDRTGKAMSTRHLTDGLNIDHIINLWNRSVTEQTPPAKPWTVDIAATSTTTSTTTTKTTQEPPVKKVLVKPPEGFFDRFNFCMKRHKITDSPDQQIVIKCLKAALINKIHKLLSNPTENISLFNGYLEFQKLETPHKKEVPQRKKVTSESVLPKKKYSSKVATKKSDESEPFVQVPLKQPKVSQTHGNDYYESYQKMLRELVARKTGAELSRQKRDDEQTKTLEKSAKLFESGRKLISEINNNLENDEDHVETLTQTILDPELVSTINNFTKAYSLRLNFYPGVAARMTRNDNSGVTFDLELDDINEAVLQSDDGGREGEKKKGKKKKISKKTIKKLFPYLLIPFMIQAALLPIVLKFLMFVAIKALIAGKLALILVAFNAIRNASMKSDEDEYIERMGYEHYGYGQGEEYGAWVNRRTFEEGPVLPEEEQEEYAEPYSDYDPSKTSA